MSTPKTKSPPSNLQSISDKEVAISLERLIDSVVMEVTAHRSDLQHQQVIESNDDALDIDSLPDEIIVEVFKYLKQSELRQIARYCYDYKPSLRTTEVACVLFKVASEFKVFSLQTLCCTFIRNAKIDPSNVFIVSEVSEQMEDKSFGDMCYKILQEKTRDVMANYELCDVTLAMVHTILSLSKLSLNSEYELIKWIFVLAKVKSEDEHSSSENARGCLERFLKDMKFLVLRMGEFATLCKDNPRLFSSDEIISIYQNIAGPRTREMPDWYDNDVKFRVYTGLNE